MRAGPGLGNVGPEQADVKLACRGLGHGNTHAIVLAPATPQELLDFTFLAFELSFRWRNPVVIVADGHLAQMTGKVVLPPRVVRPGLPAWASWGDAGHRHNLISSIQLREADQEAHNVRLIEKYGRMAAAEQRAEVYRCDNAEVVVVACNGPARTALGAVETLRAEGIAVGLFRPQTLWPFPIDALLPALRRARRRRRRRGERRAARGRAAARPLPRRRGQGLAIEHVRRYGGSSRPGARSWRRCARAPRRRWRREHLLRAVRAARPGRGAEGPLHPLLRGCGHGLAHRYLSDAIEKLGIQDRTVAISPVGCGVFLHWYLDVAHSQASHGRASAVALGHKLANPASVVVSYQGDGDLASIGLLEIMQAAQLGDPNHRHLREQRGVRDDRRPARADDADGQKTTTSPAGATGHGPPLKMAEIIAGLEAPVYVERVALFDAKQRTRAAKAIEKALRTQLEDRGFSFIEVLAECPTHLKATPAEAERWVKEQMLPVFPLGVKKDVAGRELGAPGASRPSTRPRVLEAIGVRAGAGAAACQASRADRARPGRRPQARRRGRRRRADRGDAHRRAGSPRGFDATHIPSYGPESRGGTSYADVRLADGQVLSPDVPEPDVLVAFNAPSLAKFGPTVAPGRHRRLRQLDNPVAAAARPARAGRRRCPARRSPPELGQPLVKNVVALGALHAATNLLPEEALLATMRDALKGKRALVELNEEAFRRGQRFQASAG